MNDSDLDERLARFQGPTLAASDDDLDRLMSEVRASSGSEHDLATRRHRDAPSRRVVAGVVVLTVVAGGFAIPAAADVVRQYLAQADFFPAAGGEVLPDSEWVDSGAPDFDEYVRATIPDELPLPPAVERDELIGSVIESHRQTPGLLQEVGLRRSYEYRVHCAWAFEWGSAFDMDDTSARQRAEEVLQTASSWPALVATDGGGIAALYREYAALAVAGDKQAMSRHIIGADCALLTETLGR
jgi:hypothetical protein